MATVAELRKQAKESGIKGYSKMTKKELEKALHRVPSINRSLLLTKLKKAVDKGDKNEMKTLLIVNADFNKDSDIKMVKNLLTYACKQGKYTSIPLIHTAVLIASKRDEAVLKKLLK